MAMTSSASAQALDIFCRVAPYTMTGFDRIEALISAVDYLVLNQIPGAMVECGVWKGGSMMAVAYSLIRANAYRKLILFDTFEGMPPPGKWDRDLQGASASDIMSLQNRETSTVWAVASLANVQQN